MKAKSLLVIISILSVYSAIGQQTKPQKPNVIIINVDDLGYGDVGAYGATKVNTPNIDRLAGEGKKFTDFHSASAVCSPSRYALITGQYPGRIDLWGALFLKTPLVVDTTQMTIGKIMKEAGYQTAAIGKWHLGWGSTSPVDWNKELRPGPLELGFDYYYGVPVLNSHPPFVYVENRKVVGLDPDDPLVYNKHSETRWFDEKWGMEAIGGGRAAHYLYDDRMVGTLLKDKAIEWARSHKKDPFFLYFATTNIHHPFIPAPRFIGTSEAGRYGDFIHELDWMVGDLLDMLDKEGLTENTLVILTSDNGGMLNRGGQDAYRAGHKINGDLLGFKFDAWEGGHRVPFIARWPGKIEPGTSSGQMLSNIDLLATMAEIVGYDLQKGEGPDSFSMLPALTENPKKPIRDFLIIAPNKKENIAIRQGKWIYISAQGGGGFEEENVGDHGFGGPAAFSFTGQVNSDIKNGEIKDNAPPAQLYNLEADPQQAKNVYNEYPKVVSKLEMLLKKSLQAEATR